MNFDRITAPAIQAGIDYALREYAVGISEDEVRGPGRQRILSEARKVAAWQMRLGGMSLGEIGAELNGRDHTTILSLVGRGTGRHGSKIRGGAS